MSPPEALCFRAVRPSVRACGCILRVACRSLLAVYWIQAVQCFNNVNCGIVIRAVELQVFVKPRDIICQRVFSHKFQINRAGLTTLVAVCNYALLRGNM